MPSTHELLNLIIAIAAIWVAFKVAKLVFRVILFMVALASVGVVLWLLFSR